MRYAVAAWCALCACRFSSGTQGAAIPTCNDGTCDPTETTCSCPADCGASVCGDMACCPDESNATCAQDCTGTCGDGTCNPGEDLCTCPADCQGATAGDGRCCPAAGETPCTTGDCAIGTGTCGDMCCDTMGGESSGNCAMDCPSGGGVCGDHSCSGGEDVSTCPADCSGVCVGGALCLTCGLTSCCQDTCNGDGCSISCGGSSCACVLDCRPADDGTCTARCDNEDCYIDCRGVNNCDKARCENGATCLLLCEGANNCQFEQCDGGGQSCAGGMYKVCNRPCPM